MIACTASYYRLLSTDSVMIVKLAVFVPSLDIGGLSSLAIELGTAAKLRGNIVEIYTLYPSEFILDLSLDVKSLDVPPPRFGFLKPIIAFRRTFQAYRNFKRFRPDFVICLDPSSAFICFVLRALNSDFRLSVACYTPSTLLSKSDMFIIRTMYHYADQVVAPARSSGKNLLQMNSRIKLRIVPNPYSSSSSSCLLDPTLSTNRNNCLYLGRLSKEKGVEQVLNIAEEASELSFKIAGGGAEEAFLKKAIIERKITNVTMIGWQNPSDCLPNAQVLILPSIVETFGIVIIESWIHGIPVVASIEADGPRELISNFGGGALIRNYANTSEWVANIRDQIKNPLSDEFLVEIITRFSAYELVQDWINI